MYIERCKHGSVRGLHKPTVEIRQGGVSLLDNHSTNTDEPCAYFDNNPELGEDEENYESMHDWLSSKLDIEYIISSRGEYKHGIVTTGTGGPHIEVDTRTKTVNGYWWSEKADVSVDSETIRRLDEALEEMYERK